MQPWPLNVSVCFPLSLSLSVEAIVEFDYQAQHDDELTIAVGDIISNIRKDEGGWWEGELDGRRGLFPDNFVRVSAELSIRTFDLSLQEVVDEFTASLTMWNRFFALI